MGGRLVTQPLGEASPRPQPSPSAPLPSGAHSTPTAGPGLSAEGPGGEAPAPVLWAGQPAPVLWAATLQHQPPRLPAAGQPASQPGQSGGTQRGPGLGVERGWPHARLFGKAQLPPACDHMAPGGKRSSGRRATQHRGRIMAGRFQCLKRATSYF